MPGAEHHYKCGAGGTGIHRMHFDPYPYVVGQFQGLKQISYLSLVHVSNFKNIDLHCTLKKQYIDGL
jgi:hypothetical protein